MLSIIDRGDGVKGHYCIGRPYRGKENYPSLTWEFWNDWASGWRSAGTVYENKKDLFSKLRELLKEEEYNSYVYEMTSI